MMDIKWQWITDDELERLTLLLPYQILDEKFQLGSMLMQHPESSYLIPFRSCICSSEKPALPQDGRQVDKNLVGEHGGMLFIEGKFASHKPIQKGLVGRYASWDYVFPTLTSRRLSIECIRELYDIEQVSMIAKEL